MIFEFHLEEYTGVFHVEKLHEIENREKVP